MASPAAAPSSADWKHMKVQELRNALASKGLDTSGLKVSLLERLRKSRKASSEVAATETPRQEEMPVEENSAEPSVKAPTMVDNAEKDGTSGQPQDTSSSHLEPPKDLVPSAPALHKKPAKAGPLTEFEKKRRRAERFGTHPNFSEDEKRRIRAARFGIVDEEAKKEARAERFGKDLQEQNLRESEKRKIRAARFGTVSENNNVKTKG